MTVDPISTVGDAAARVARGGPAARGVSPATLSRREIEHFERDGFLVIDRPLVGPEDLAAVRALLDDLFARFEELPSKKAYDLGDVQHHDGPLQIPEINQARELEARLSATAAFARCQELARQLLSDRAECVWDHAILKPPHSNVATEWHQDLARAPQNEKLDAVHIWFALQEATEENGCMHFIPDNGRRGLLPHHTRGPLSHALVADDVDAGAAVACPIDAGMATIHRLSTLHYTGPNTTNGPRLAWILVFHDRPPARWTTRWTTRSRVALSRVRRAFSGRGARTSTC